MLTVKQLNLQHPEYKLYSEWWRRLDILYDEVLMKQHIPEFLTSRPKELPEIYEKRQEIFDYDNILSACLGFFRAALFKKSPSVTMVNIDENGLPKGPVPKSQAAFYTFFRGNTDGAGGSFVSHLKDAFISMALQGRVYTMIDIVKTDPNTTLLDQKRANLVDAKGKPSPRAMIVPVHSVINWSVGRDGTYDWVVIHSVQTEQPTVLDEPVNYDVWTVLDRTNYTIYRRKKNTNGISNGAISGLLTVLPSDGDSQVPELVDQGTHLCAAARQVPLVRSDVTSTLWLGKRVHYPVCAHLNQSNSLAWQLFMSNLAMPIITCDEEISPTVAEGGFIKLPANATFKWSEPDGNSTQWSMQQKDSLREEVYRLMYLMYQGKQASATGDGASGASKAQELEVALEAMNEFGDHIIAHGQSVLNMVALARKEPDIRADIRGLRFGRSATLAQIQATEATLSLDIPSIAFEKAVEADFAVAFFEDANAQLTDLIVSQIEAAPPRADRFIVAQKAQADASAVAGEAGGKFNQPPKTKAPAESKVSPPAGNG